MVTPRAVHSGICVGVSSMAVEVGVAVDSGGDSVEVGVGVEGILVGETVGVREGIMVAVWVRVGDGVGVDGGTVGVDVTVRVGVWVGVVAVGGGVQVGTGVVSQG